MQDADMMQTDRHNDSLTNQYDSQPYVIQDITTTNLISSTKLTFYPVTATHWGYLGPEGHKSDKEPASDLDHPTIGMKFMIQVINLQCQYLVRDCLREEMSNVASSPADMA